MKLEESPNADEHDNFKTSGNETEQLAIKLRKYVTSSQNCSWLQGGSAKDTWHSVFAFAR